MLTPTGPLPAYLTFYSKCPPASLWRPPVKAVRNASAPRDVTRLAVAESPMDLKGLNFHCNPAKTKGSTPG
ncbi:hypothetical protein E2C01_062402 [Portunus trituberculatus]|uniref:Uncharacterized protein n=1 Tax=Portunus trituberculatus TaxID=210409 RepID=A0A5B7HF74_PORTR|nr:hypothetical protein [Portunus trituberculatus]